jgi:hypothetical protein
MKKNSKSQDIKCPLDPDCKNVHDIDHDLDLNQKKRIRP